MPIPGTPTTQVEVTMQFYRKGIPATDINTVTPGFPKVRIWNTVTNAIVINNSSMLTMAQGATNDGFYKYVFNEAAGFVENTNYTVHFDAGSSIPDGERYNNGTIIPSYENEIYRKLEDVEDLGEDISDKIDNIFSTTNHLRKFETNRTWIDVNNAELHVYDDDCKTILWRFKLLDSRGQPSIDEIAERLPIVGGNLPFTTCSTP